MIEEFERLLNEYNGVKARHGYYGFDNIEVVSAGERDPDAEGLEGMSASKMRKAAMDGDFDSFKQGVPDGFKDVEKLYRDVRNLNRVKSLNCNLAKIYWLGFVVQAPYLMVSILLL